MIKRVKLFPQPVKHTHRDIINILLDTSSRCALVSYGLIFFPLRLMALLRALTINKEKTLGPYCTLRTEKTSALVRGIYFIVIFSFTHHKMMKITSDIHVPSHTPRLGSLKMQLYFYGCLPSTLIRHENVAFRKRSSNRRNLKTPDLCFNVDRKPSFWKP